MTAEIDENGSISTYQGDTILFNCDNVPTDVPYIVYWSVRDLKTDADIIDQVPFIPTGSTVEISIPPNITDSIPVPEGKKFKDYRHALKACNAENNIEHTLLIGDTEVGTEYKLRMYRKQSEGTPTPSPEPTPAPTEEPTEAPTEEPTSEPTDEPTSEPTEEPTEQGE